MFLWWCKNIFRKFSNFIHTSLIWHFVLVLYVITIICMLGIMRGRFMFFTNLLKLVQYYTNTHFYIIHQTHAHLYYLCNEAKRITDNPSLPMSSPQFFDNYIILCCLHNWHLYSPHEVTWMWQKTKGLTKNAKSKLSRNCTIVCRGYNKTISSTSLLEAMRWMIFA